MTIPVSTVDTTRDYLVSHITTQVADTSVLVCFDQPGTNQPEDVISVGDIILDATLHAFVGNLANHSMMENYTVEVTIRVVRANDDPQTVWKRAKALSDAVDTVVRTDPSLGSTVIVAYPSRAVFAAAVIADHTGRMVTVTKTITVEAES